MKNTLPIALFLSKDAEKISFFKETFKNNFALIPVSDSKDALDWIKNTPVELLILEKALLEGSLETLCKSAKKLTKGKNLPILLLSNTLKKSAILEALNAGVTDFIHEPLDEHEIQERVAVCLHPKQVNKKVGMIRSKIKASPLIPRNAKVLQEKTLIRDETLQIISNAKKGSIPLSVLMVHLDSLSKIQESFTPPSLKEFFEFLENFLTSHLRKYDSLVTEGPGQYLILLPKTSPSAAKIIAEEMQKEISTSTIVTSEKELLVTLSIGVVSFEKELSKSAKDFEKFDLCLERVKKSLIRSQKKSHTIISKT